MNIRLDIKNKKHIRKLVLSGLFLALCLLLPFVTGQIQQIGQMLAPMHLPVLLCGVVCGPLWGAAVGLTAPLLRYALFGMPPIFPMGLSMAFELCTYGLVIGLMYKLLPKSRGAYTSPCSPVWCWAEWCGDVRGWCLQASKAAASPLPCLSRVHSPLPFRA